LPTDDTQLGDFNGFVTINDSEEKDKEEYKSFDNLLKSLDNLEYNDTPSLEDVIDDQDLDLSVNEKPSQINGRTRLPIGDVAHTVGSQWGETETEEVSPPVPQEDSEETPEVNSQKDSESQPTQESHGKEDRLARNKSKILIKNPGAITRSKSINRYNDTSSTPMDPNDVIVDKPSKN
jgi:hypothetical protein